MTERSTLKITVIKKTDLNPDQGAPSISIGFTGEPMSASDQRILIECLVDDLVRKIDDCKERHVED